MLTSKTGKALGVLGILSAVFFYPVSLPPCLHPDEPSTVGPRAYCTCYSQPGLRLSTRTRRDKLEEFSVP